MPQIFLSLKCPNCGKGIKPEVSLCPHCGVDLDAPLEESELGELVQEYLVRAQKILDSGRGLKNALTSCDEALEVDPTCAPAHNLRGLILDGMGKPVLAMRAYREALRLDPNYTEAQQNLAEAESEYRQPVQKKGAKFLPARVVFGIVLCMVVGTGAFLIINSLRNYLLTPKTTILLEPDLALAPNYTKPDLDNCAEILSQRWQAMGYGWVRFKANDQGQITAQIPEDVDAETIRRSIALGVIEFVDFGKTSLPDGATVYTDIDNPFLPRATGKQWHTIMQGQDIQTATANPESKDVYNISFTLTKDGTKIFKDYTSGNIGSYLGVVLDKVVLMTPMINSTIADGQGVIAGNYTKASASALAAILSSRPLPIPLKLIEKK
jgi:hypothetical protein